MKIVRVESIVPPLGACVKIALQAGINPTRVHQGANCVLLVVIASTKAAQSVKNVVLELLSQTGE